MIIIIGKTSILLYCKVNVIYFIQFQYKLLIAKNYVIFFVSAVCDHRGKFIDVFIGCAGKMHDARVFRKSILKRKIFDQANPLMRQEQHLIGDSAYPLLMNLMTPFRDDGHLDAAKINYNIRLSSIRSIIERAFGCLKCKFRRLKYLDVASVETANVIISACCMLHNFILSNGEEIDMEENNENEDVPAPNPGNEHQRIQNQLQRQEAVTKRLRIMNLLQ